MFQPDDFIARLTALVPRPRAHRDGAFLRDPDGHKVEAAIASDAS